MAAVGPVGQVVLQVLAAGGLMRLPCPLCLWWLLLMLLILNKATKHNGIHWLPTHSTAEDIDHLGHPDEMAILWTGCCCLHTLLLLLLCLWCQCGWGWGWLGWCLG